MRDLFDFRPANARYAVMGNPIAHSQSPQIHTAFAQQFDLRIEYSRIQVDLGGFESAVSHFAAQGGAGLNVTVPFKLAAWRLCHQSGHSLSEYAATAEAVNTLKFADGAVRGDNTDGLGLRRDLEHNLHFNLCGTRVLILGAGGAVRGVLPALLERQPQSVCIVNRTAAKACQLATQLRPLNANIHGCGYAQLPLQPYDLIINGSAASLHGELPDVDNACVAAHTLVYDMMYADQPTRFMQWASAAGAGAVSDGLGMLVEQAAQSFFIWHAQRPDTAAVLHSLRKT